MCQSINPVDVIANVATGGLYGAGQSLAKGQVGSALENLGPWGSAVHPINPQIADMGNAIGAGAGIAGGLTGPEGAFTPGAGTGALPVPPMITDANGYAAMSVNVDPITGFAMPGAGLTPAQLMSGAGAAAMGSPAGSGLAPMAGAQAGQQIAGFLGGAAPQLVTPQGGAFPAGQAGNAPSQQQIALMGSQQNDPYRGLAPRYEARMAGTREAPGIATIPLVSDYYKQ